MRVHSSEEKAKTTLHANVIQIWSPLFARPNAHILLYAAHGQERDGKATPGEQMVKTRPSSTLAVYCGHVSVADCSGIAQIVNTTSSYNYLIAKKRPRASCCFIASVVQVIHPHLRRRPWNTTRVMVAHSRNLLQSDGASSLLVFA